MSKDENLEINHSETPKNTDNGDTTPKNEELKTERIAKDYSGLSAEQLLSELSKKDKVIQDKHNFALKNEQELKKYKEKEEQERIKSEEEKGNYEKLTQEMLNKSNDLEETNKDLSKQLEKLMKEKKEVEDEQINQLLSQIPEKNREFAEMTLKPFSGKERIQTAKGFVELFGESTSFGGKPKSTKKELSEVELLKEKLEKQGYLSPSEERKLEGLTD